MGYERDVQGRIVNPLIHKVLWVSFHRSFRKNIRNYDIAILGLKWSLQFSTALTPLCLPDFLFSDINKGYSCYLCRLKYINLILF